MEHESPARLQLRGHRQWTPLARALAAMGDRWTLLIVLALSNETLRLSALRVRLPGVSSGVLDHHLSQMTAQGLISRERFREMPPRVEVSLTDQGRELLPIAGALARWGMRHEWPPPPKGEYVPASAVLRQLPALLDDRDDLPSGSLELVVSDDEERAAYRFEIADGRLRAAAVAGAKPTARVEGDDGAWIAALGPSPDYSGLRVGGRRRMAKQILEALPRDGAGVKRDGKARNGPRKAAREGRSGAKNGGRRARRAAKR